jgi:UDP-N-acetyl-D-mannosaminuronic acid dehydrogenase
MQKQDQKIGIIGGCGHIGLPLGLVLAKEGFQVTLIDSNEESVGLVSRRIMPFMEADADNLLEEVINNGNLRVTADKSEIKNQNIIFVCIGTPVDEHQSPVPRVFANFLESIKEYLQRDQIMVLRSTVFPGTSDWLEKKLSLYGVDLAFCPERIVQGQAISELYSLPQIISANAQLCEQRVSRVFQTFSPSIVIANFKEAEFAKLFLNAYRYIQFAATNEFFMLADQAGIDYAKVHSIMIEGYARAKDFPKAGLAAGPCLLKDTQQLLAFGQNQFQIGNAAIMANEGLALRLISIAERYVPLENSTIGLLGMAFKANNDDIRSSLSYRVRKMLQLRAKKVLSADPFVTNDSSLVSEEELIRDSDLIIICTPHSRYTKLTLDKKKVIDIWNVTGNGLLFYPEKNENQ